MTTANVTHTPGPWHAGAGNGAGSVFAESGRMRFESGGTTLYPICSVIDFDGEADANAALIAAAPELLAALELVYSNAAESPEWIRARIAPVIAKATAR